MGELGGPPQSGLRVQMCGDAHLDEPRSIRSPERNMLFDIKDSTRRCPAVPWGPQTTGGRLRSPGGPGLCSRPIGARWRWPGAGVPPRWPRGQDAHLGGVVRRPSNAEPVDRLGGGRWPPAPRERSPRVGDVAKARTKEASGPSAGSPHIVDGELRIVAAPPLSSDRGPGAPGPGPRGGTNGPGAAHRLVPTEWRTSTTPSKSPLVHMARKVVGVERGHRSWVLSSWAMTEIPSCCRPKRSRPRWPRRFAGASEFPHHGQRVVVGQRLCRRRATSSWAGSGCPTSTGVSATANLQLQTGRVRGGDDTLRVPGATL